MKTKKHRLEPLSFYDHTGIEKHLSKMAQKGWMIERITNQYWTYRKIEPQNLTFAVTYYASASDFDADPSDKQLGFYDYCSRNGWELACTWFQMQIFYSSLAHPVPIDTDPVYEVKTIHNGCKANYLKGYWILLILGLIGFYFLLSGIIGHTLHMLSSASHLFMGMCGTLLLVLSSVELICYYTWHRRAVSKAECGIFLDTPSTSPFQTGILVVLGIGVLLWGVDLIFGEKMLMFWIAILVFSAIFGTKLLTNKVKLALKKKHVSAGANRILTVLSSFLIAFVLMSMAFTIGTILSRQDVFEGTFKIQEPPFRIEDLNETAYDEYIIENKESSSVLVNRFGIHQRHGFDDEASPDIPEMEYVIYTIKIPWLLNFCEDQLKRTALLGHGDDAYLVEIHPDHWGADRVYQVVDTNGTPLSDYVIVYGDQLIELNCNWELDDTQISFISSKLSALNK